MSATYGGTAAAETTIPRMPRGVDRVSYYNTGEEEEVARGWAPSCLWDWFNWDTGSPVFGLQDLKDKKVQEDKENGKDSATNGKV